MIKFRYLPTKNSKQFSSKRRNKGNIQAIVIHDTGNTSKGAGALNHKTYLDGATRQGSAHFYVDDKEIIQTIGDSRTAWSVGDTWGHKNNPNRLKDLNNYNTISIEMCINSDGNYKQMYYNTVELVKNLMEQLNIKRVVRHYDITGKSCPDHFKPNNWERWEKFLTDIKQPLREYIDLTKTETEGVKMGDKVEVKENKTVKVQFERRTVEVPTILKEGSNFIQIRNLFEQLGYTVEWNGETETIIIY